MKAEKTDVSGNKYLVALAACPFFGPARIKLLLSYFDSAEKIWFSNKNTLTGIGIGEEKTDKFVQFRNKFNIGNYFNDLKKQKINVTTILDKTFPKKLKELDDSPVVIYYKGSLSGLNNPCVAIVGSRKITSYGKEATEIFSGELSAFGVTIVSGLARGVDAIAHKACLSAGGATVAVLGNGLDTVYPDENKHLAEEIINGGGGIVSEYPLGTPIFPTNFAVRNRIISGLSDIVLIVEGAEKSGTLLTASHAANQGKTVFAVPGQITSPLSAAPHFLLKNGARIATDVKDILDELNMEVKVDKEKVSKILPDTPEENEILKVLTDEPLHLDELVRIVGGKTPEISARLTIMEMKGFIKNLGGDIYKKI